MAHFQTILDNPELDPAWAKLISNLEYYPAPDPKILTIRQDRTPKIQIRNSTGGEWIARYSHPVPHSCDIWRHWSENTSQLIFVWQQQAWLQNLGPLKILIGSCTYFKVDSGSNLIYWHQLLLQPKTQTPAGVLSGTPAPWSSLI